MDLCFKEDEGRLNIRTGAIILKDGKMLAAHSERPYWHTVGGRIQLGEDSRTCVEREVLEETGIPFEADRLVFVAETFFTEEASGERFHELCFYYLMKPNGREGEIGDSFREGEATERLGWLDISRLKEEDLRPWFLEDELKHIPDGVKHIIVKEE